MPAPTVVAPLIRWLAAWALYLAGRALCWAFDGDRGSLHLPFYRVYNRMMRWSADIQGPGPNGPWSAEETVK